MEKPQYAQDIMARKVVTCAANDTLAHVQNLMREHSIRHVPVVDPDTGDFQGLVTQKTMLREVFRIADRFGMADFEHQANKKKVAELMDTGVETIQPQLPLLEAGRYFVSCKHGCLPVVDNGKIVGILTSADFVKLSVRLLEA